MAEKKQQQKEEEEEKEVPKTQAKPPSPKTKSMLKVEKTSYPSEKPNTSSEPKVSSPDKKLDVEKKKESLEQTKEDKKEKTGKKKDEKPKVKKYEAVANGSSMPVSTKQASYICSFIKGKEIDSAIADLNLVLSFKKAVPFKGEIPHRKGKGMMSGRYPLKASKLFINLLKALKGNAIVNGLEIDRTRIAIASASQAARPMRSGGRSAKRTHVILKAKETKGEQK